jgi:hypothetical protein
MYNWEFTAVFSHIQWLTLRKFLKVSSRFYQSNSVYNFPLTSVTVFLPRHSFIDAMIEMLDQNMAVLSIGFVLIFVYVTVSIGKFNCLEHRVRESSWTARENRVCNKLRPIVFIMPHFNNFFRFTWRSWALRTSVSASFLRTGCAHTRVCFSVQSIPSCRSCCLVSAWTTCLSLSKYVPLSTSLLWYHFHAGERVVFFQLIIFID